MSFSCFYASNEQGTDHSVFWTSNQAWASRVALVVKNWPVNARDVRDTGSIPGLGRFPGGRHGNPLQYSWLKNPMNRGAWQATVHGVAKSQTQLKCLSMQQTSLEDRNSVSVFPILRKGLAGWQLIRRQPGSRSWGVFACNKWPHVQGSHGPWALRLREQV